MTDNVPRTALSGLHKVYPGQGCPGYTSVSETLEEHKTMMKTLKHYLDYAIEGGAVIAFIGMCLAILIQVFARYLFQFPTPWAEELSRLLNIWAVFLAAAWAAKKGTHITIRAILDRLPDAWQRPVILLIDIAVSLLLLAVFWGSITMMQSSYTMFSTALHIRMTYFYLPLAIGSFAMLCYYLGGIISTLTQKR